MVIVPSSAVETTGLGGSLATAVLGGANHFVFLSNKAEIVDGMRASVAGLY